MREKQQTEELRKKLEERRDKRQIEKKLLKVKSIAESATKEDDDAASWIEKMRRIQKMKEEAAKRAKQLDEADEAFGVGEVVSSELAKQKNRAYTSRDLHGLKVEHDRVS